MKNEEDFVLVIGSSNMDLNIYSDRFPKTGETVTGGTFTQSLGGKGANQAVASVRSGTKTVFIGKVGEDTFGTQMVEQLTNEGINTSNMIITPDVASGVAIILIDSQGQNMISVAPGANEKLGQEDLKDTKEIIEEASVVIMQMEIQMEVIREICHTSFQKEAILILNPAPFKEIPLKVLKRIDIITPNENELYQLHQSLGFNNPKERNHETLSQVTKDLHSRGVNTIIVTLGDKGCFISASKNGEQFHIPAIEVTAIDTVGAGDCFNGVLASRLCKCDNLRRATKYANVAASIAVTRRGAQTSIPFRDEIDKRFTELDH
jgi:ribokinase